MQIFFEKLHNMRHYIFDFARIYIMLIAIYPYVLFFYSYSLEGSEKSIKYWLSIWSNSYIYWPIEMPGSPIIFAFLSAILSSIIFWHLLFINALINKRVSKALRSAIKSTDYLWYFVGGLLSLFVVIDIQKINDAGYAVSSARRADVVDSALDILTKEIANRCNGYSIIPIEFRTYRKIEAELCSKSQEEEGLSINEAIIICKDLRVRNRNNILKIPSEHYSTEIKQELLYLSIWCSTIETKFKADKRENEYKYFLEKLQIPLIEGQIIDPRFFLAYLFVFSFAVGGKISKTTFDVLAELRK